MTLLAFALNFSKVAKTLRNLIVKPVFLKNSI